MVSARSSFMTCSSGEVLTGIGGSGRDNALLGKDDAVVEGTESSELAIPARLVDEDVPKSEEVLSVLVGLNFDFLMKLTVISESWEK